MNNAPRHPSATNRQLAVRLAVSRALARTRDLDGVYSAALDALWECLAVSRASVLLFDPDGVMRFKAYRGLSAEYRAAVEGHSPWTPDSLFAQPVLVPDVTDEPTLQSYLPIFSREGIAALGFVPLISLGRVIGKFMLYYDRPHTFDDEEVELVVVIAAAVAFAVERGRASESPEVRAPWQAEAFQAGQHQVLEMIATGAPLTQTLSLLVHLVEDQCPDIIGSVMLLDADGSHVRVGAAPSLPAEFARRTDGQPLTARIGCSCSVMQTGRGVIALDIENDSRWDDVRDIATVAGLKTCCSAPIFSQNKQVLGCFTMFCRSARTPDREEFRLLETAADLAGAAIDHQRAHDALRHSEERNRAILRAIPDWMFVLSREGTFLDYHVKNPEALLVPPDQFLGRSMHDVLPAWLADAHMCAFERALATNECEQFEYSLDQQHGQRFYEACIVPYENNKLLSIVRDITDRKRAELDAATQRQELAHLNRVLILAEQSGALAHELSQPLAAVMANAQAARRMLEQHPLQLDELRDTLDDIIKHDQRAGAVIHHLRALLKKKNAVLQPVDLNEITREVIDLTHSDLLARRVPLVTSLATEIPAILGDRVQLQQVILNLVLNSCESMSTVEPTAREISVTTCADQSFVQLAVADRGIGLPDGKVEALFEPFVTHRAHGLGLGLSMSRSIVVAHQGRIEAHNNRDGPGATFRCFLPVARLA